MLKVVPSCSYMDTTTISFVRGLVQVSTRIDGQKDYINQVASCTM